MTERCAFHLRHSNRRSSLGDDFGDRLTRAAAKKDRSVATPTAAARLGAHRTNRLRRAAVGVDLLEISAGEKSDEATIGRPERIRPFFGAEERLGSGGVQRAHPKHRFPVRTNPKHDASTVR